MPRPLKQGIPGASPIILSKEIVKYAFMCGSNFYETDVTLCKKLEGGFIYTFSLLISLSITLQTSKFRNQFIISSKYFDMACYF